MKLLKVYRSHFGSGDEKLACLMVCASFSWCARGAQWRSPNARRRRARLPAMSKASSHSLRKLFYWLNNKTSLWLAGRLVLWLRVCSIQKRFWLSALATLPLPTAALMHCKKCIAFVSGGGAHTEINLRSDPSWRSIRDARHWYRPSGINAGEN